MPTDYETNDLQAELRRAVTSGDPLAALTAMRSVERGLRQWKAAIVHKSIAEGASWDEVGKALGMSRQAAWARFKDAKVEGQMEQTRTELRLEIETLKTALRAKERAGRDDARKIQDEVKALRERLAAAKREGQKERHGLKQQIREKHRLLGQSRRKAAD